jgi:ADP-ribosylglycohydrolase
MPGWETVPNLLEFELKQLLEEGVEPAAAHSAVERARALHAAGASEDAIWAVFADLPQCADYPFDEPSDLAGIRSRRTVADPAAPPPPAVLAADDSTLLNQMHGAWLGRCVGCALGKPVEAFMDAHNGLASWQRQKRYLSAISPGEWPLRDYFPARSPGDGETGRTGCRLSSREEIAFMEDDDDINYTVLGQVLLLECGAGFNSGHVANAWFNLLPYNAVCTAETQAYRNLVLRYDHFRRGTFAAEGRERFDALTDWHWVRTHLNPYREWIGAQIRVDSYGYAAPGRPELAAEFAWRDARVSHTKNGIYGAMFCAAMIAAAFTKTQPLPIVEAGLAQIPRTSRLHADLTETIAICARAGNDFENYEAVFGELYRRFDGLHPVHTNNNAALCVAALLLSGGDFERGITLAVMGGWDSDCNGATVGSIVGAIAGAARVPAHWAGRLNDTLRAGIAGYNPASIQECARRSVAVARRVEGEVLAANPPL